MSRNREPGAGGFTGGMIGVMLVIAGIAAFGILLVIALFVWPDVRSGGEEGEPERPANGDVPGLNGDGDADGDGDGDGDTSSPWFQQHPGYRLIA
jgi:hypothetical protein